ncbi:hypothetical protein OH807_30830 [Kitasatospora sp. NBC_01560]|uniref:hypothetical protein n=1 Tax=Kitasatospora sp. NBC_01560 TaxID=2975965 RepID=UPI00386D8A1A
MITPTSPPTGEPSLRELAEAGQLPDHQVMDRATLAWIAGHRPAGADVRARLPQSVRLLVPNASWFARTETTDSIHGVRHGARVALLVQFLAPGLGLVPERVLALAAAAACHDCRRRHDRDDPGHGRRTARWLASHLDTVTSAFGTAPSAEAVVAVALHDVPHHTFDQDDKSEYRRHGLAVDLLKLADALDRYRLPLPRWWPDPGRLRLPVPDWAPALAHDLVVRSERARRDGACDAQALELALHAVRPE